MSQSSSPFYLQILIKFIANCVVVWFLSHYIHDFFAVTGGWQGIVVVGALITLLNMVVRPVLSAITFPLKLFATIIAIIIVNGAIVQIAAWMVQLMNPAIVTLTIGGGLVGWTVVTIIIGFTNWFMKEALQ